MGKPFSKMMKLKPGETVVFSWVRLQVAGSSRSRDAKVMKEMEEKMGDMKDMPMDPKRMVYGGCSRSWLKRSMFTGH